VRLLLSLGCLLFSSCYRLTSWEYWSFVWSACGLLWDVAFFLAVIALFYEALGSFFRGCFCSSVRSFFSVGCFFLSSSNLWLWVLFFGSAALFSDEHRHFLWRRCLSLRQKSHVGVAIGFFSTASAFNEIFFGGAAGWSFLLDLSSVLPCDVLFLLALARSTRPFSTRRKSGTPEESTQTPEESTQTPEESRATG